jgi:hypothetical protein
LWLLGEQIMSTLTILHDAGLNHGDAELHNVIVCSAPLEVLPIDFDMAVQRANVDDEDWERRCKEELDPLLRVAIFLQCALGAQPGPLDSLFQRSDPFRRAIEDCTGLHAQTRR